MPQTIKRTNLCVMIILAVSFLLLPATSSSYINSNVVSSANGVVSSDAYSFNIRGTAIGENIFNPNAINYHGNAGAILKNLGVNVVSISTGSEGDVWGINMVNNAVNDAWADNLESLLATINSTGFKCYLYDLGDPWGGELGIQDPSGIMGSNPPMDITLAKTYIDKLAGNNKLNHNFITDPRISFWHVASEAVIGTGVLQKLNMSHYLITIIPNSNYYWIIQMCDYIRSKGGKVVVPSPAVDTSTIDGISWNTNFKWTEPLLQGHVDYLEWHNFGLWELGTYYSLGNQTYDWAGWKANMQKQLQTMVDYKGNFTINQLIYGEFGIWRGTGTDAGLVNWYFNDVNRRDYYNNIFQAIENVGLINVCFHYSFEEQRKDGSLAYPTLPFGVIDPNGQPYLYASDIIKQNYAP